MSSARTTRVTSAAAIKPQTAHQTTTRMCCILPPVELLYTRAITPTKARPQLLRLSLRHSHSFSAWPYRRAPCGEVPHCLRTRSIGTDGSSFHIHQREALQGYTSVL